MHLGTDDSEKTRSNHMETLQIIVFFNTDYESSEPLKTLVMLCYVMLCYGMLCYVMLGYVMLCYVMLCYVMLGYVMLC